MKQVKQHYDFIYYTKYKSSWITLDTNLKKKKRTKKFSIFDSTKWLPLAAVTVSQILGILSTKDWR